MHHLEPSDDVALAGFLAGQPLWSRHVANAALSRSRSLGIDPMDALASAVPGDPERPYRNAAQLLEVAYSADIAPFVSPLGQSASFQCLASLRTARGVRNGRETLFLSPRFAQIEALLEKLENDPGLAEKLCIISPATLARGLCAANAHHLCDNAVQGLARAFPLAGAHLDLPFVLRALFLAFLLAVIVLSISSHFAVQPLMVVLVTLGLGAPSAFRVWAAFTFGRNRPLRPRLLLGDADLPVYSVLIPLRDEAHMVDQIVSAMRALDYPPEKLDIKFIVESTSPLTIRAVERHLGDPRFSLVAVPDRSPRTKPKALNYALPLARGEHVVVYDAEDIPEPGQLRMAASLFAQAPVIECLQAELMIANAEQNWLTRMFAAEYAGHFGVLLPAIGRRGFPVPLGGTSNHFRTATLRRIGAWDAFNVTEDADLGIRMARLGLTVESLAAVTWEEAPTTVSGWLGQRSRWIKGWMQTLLVHLARPRTLLADLGPANLSVFLIFFGGMVVSLALHAVFLVVLLYRIGQDIVTAGIPSLWSIAGLGALLLGYGGAAAISAIGLDRIGRFNLFPWLATLPAYWLLAWFALARASWDLLLRPYHWAKTKHHGYELIPHPTAQMARQPISDRRADYAEQS